MADNPISKSDIIDDSVAQALKDITATLENLAKIMNEDLKAAANSLNQSLQGVNVSTKEGQEIVKKASKEAEFLAAQQKELNRLDKERLQAQAKLNVATSKEAQDVAKLKFAIEQKNKAVKEAARQDTSAEGSINQMRAKLKQLIVEYNELTPAVRDQAAPAIRKLTEELKKAESAIGNNTRNVGNYKGSILAAGKQLLAFTGITGGTVTVLNALKDAFFETEQGANIMKRTTTSLKAFLQSVVTGDMMSAIPKAVAAWKSAGELNKIRIGDRKDVVEIAKLESQIAILRYKSVDATLSEAEQLSYLNKAMAKEDELIKYKIADKKEELEATYKLMGAMTDDTDLLNKSAQLEAEIIALEGDRNYRLMSRASAIRERLSKVKELTDEEYESAQRFFRLLKYEAPTDRQLNQIFPVDDWDKGMEKARQDFHQFKEDQKAQWKEVKAAEIAETQKAEEEKNAIITEGLTQAANSLTVFGDLFETAKQRELSAVGDNAKAREEIERKYARRQQILSIGQALINGAMAITEIQKKWAANPVMMGILTALESARTIAQVSVIKSQKFAKGGSGILEGAVHASGGVPIMGVGEAEGGEHISITSRAMTSKYGGRMLDAVSSSINQGKFFEVWANANKGMGVTADPYTKKMYELMTKTPTVYTDSTGATVKEYADGRKIIIKKMQYFKN